MANPAGPDAGIPVKLLAELTGLSPVLIRAWERRYAFPAEPRRTAGGHRRYTAREVEMLRHAAMLVRSGLRAADAVARARAGEVPAAESREADAASLTALLLKPDPAPALTHLHAAWVGLGLEPALEEMAFPALRTIGEMWAAGEVSVAAEHAATGVVMSWLGAIRSELPAQDLGPPRLVVATPEGEEHEVAVWALDLLLRLRGVPCRALGASVPASDLVAECRRPGLGGLVLCVTWRPAGRRLAGVAAALREAGAATPVYVGGAATPSRLPAGLVRLPATVTASAARLAEDLSTR